MTSTADVAQGGMLPLTVEWFASPGGAPADVTGLQITISPLGGGAAVIGPTSTGIVHEATGVYSYIWAVDPDAEITEYLVLWTADGPIQASETVTVIDGPGDLVASLTEFKSWIKYRTSGTADDDKLTMCLTSASSWVEWRTGSRLAPTTLTERLRASGDVLMQHQHPLISVTSIVPEYGAALPTSGYTADTTNSLIRLAWGGYGHYDVTYVAGMVSVPTHRKHAGLEVARHLWAVQNGSAGRGAQDEDLITTPMGFAVPARAEELITIDPDNTLMPGFA